MSVTRQTHKSAGNALHNSRVGFLCARMKIQQAASSLGGT